MKKQKFIPLNIKIFLIYFASITFFSIVVFTPGLLDFLLNKISIKYFIMLSFILFCTLMFIAIYIFILKSIIKIKVYTEKNTGIEGDLTTRLFIKYNDEFGRFSKNFNIFLAKIHNIVFKLKNIIKSSNEMGQTLASNTTESAASIKEITATINSMKEREYLLKNHVGQTHDSTNDIKKSIKEIRNLIEAQALALTEASTIIEESIASISNLNSISKSKKDFINSLQDMAKEGNNDMSNTLGSIKDIAKSIDSIQTFIRIINNVAQQTNLLAMNAAIEAAHAGKFGGGFSVVANEIRTLSESSALNAKNISSNLNNIISIIKFSESLTTKTDKSIKELINGIQEVSNMMSQIIISFDEISIGTSGILNALNKLLTSNEDIKFKSKIIDEKSDKIYSAMNDITILTEQSTQSFTEFAISINEIEQVTEYISNIGSKNYENIQIMEDEIEKFKIIDTSILTSSDGQPLIQWNYKAKQIPPRPDHPEQYPEYDERHWYDMEYAGWNEKKINIPESPTDGAKGKNIIVLLPGIHPYYEGYIRGMKKISDAFSINVKHLMGDYNNPDIQIKQVDEALKGKPDLIILVPADAKKAIEYFKKINNAGIPVISATQMPDNEAFKYVLGYTGTDEWKSFRELAKKFMEFMNKKGNYCIIQHAPGGGPYYARTYAIISELQKHTDKMKCLDMKYTGFDRNKTKAAVLNWIKKYKDELKGIVTADHSEGILGIYDALEEKKIKNMIVVSQGHNKLTLDLIKEKKLHAITMQSAETDGALPIELAIDYFNGLEIMPVKYMPVQIITIDNVDKFYPPQW